MPCSSAISASEAEKKQAAAEAASISDQGGRWQASVGISIDAESIEFLGAEDSATVNGRKVEGPCVVFRKTQLRETSFVPVGADQDTSSIALTGHQQEASVMPADNVDPIAAERARTSVTRSIRYATTRIAEHHPSLGQHLRQAINTGTYCCYTPDPRVPVCWTVTSGI